MPQYAILQEQVAFWESVQYPWATAVQEIYDSSRRAAELTQQLLTFNVRDAMPGGGNLTITMTLVSLTEEKTSESDDASRKPYSRLQVIDGMKNHLPIKEALVRRANHDYQASRK